VTFRLQATSLAQTNSFAVGCKMSQHSNSLESP
jgi:hypothetical protein